jgi:hypothetical protein
MPLERDSEAEIVITRFWGIYTTGLLVMLGGIGWIAGGITGAAGIWEPETGADTAVDRIALGLTMGAIGIVVLLFGLLLAGPTTDIGFNEPPGYMTMRWRTWHRHWPPFTRTRRISIEEIQRVSINSVTRVNPTGGSHRRWYQVWVATPSGKNVLLLDHDDRKVANRLVRRVSNFARDAYFEQAFAHAEKGDYQRAITDYDRVIEMDSKDAEAYFNRALAHEGLGDVEHAIADMEESLSLQRGRNARAETEKIIGELRSREAIS